MIQTDNLTLKYSNEKGVFGLNFKVNKGQITGYLGPNGSGKTTTIRCLMGFMKPDAGICKINNLDCFKDADKIQKFTGYLPGEISFFNSMSGEEFIKFICDMRKVDDMTLKNKLLDIFELDLKGKIKKYSKGMKQKLGIITAFLHDPQIVILDEPTSGLDPIMQNRFVDFILEEKKRNKTILMSSHMFEEIERTCDDVIIIKEGKIVEKTDVITLKETQCKTFILTSIDMKSTESMLNESGFKYKKQNNQYEIIVSGEKINHFINLIAKIEIKDLNIKTQKLEDLFLQFYK